MVNEFIQNKLGDKCQDQDSSTVRFMPEFTF